jgi:hypothetical protein
MVNVGIFYDHLEYFMAICYNLWPFGIACGHLFYFFPIWYVLTKKNLATLVSALKWNMRHIVKSFNGRKNERIVQVENFNFKIF